MPQALYFSSDLNTCMIRHHLSQCYIVPVLMINTSCYFIFVLLPYSVKPPQIFVIMRPSVHSGNCQREKLKSLAPALGIWREFGTWEGTGSTFVL